MAYRFKLAEPIQQGFQRIGLEQIERAERQLSGAEEQGASIHETRKCLKRLRALLRLVRPGLTEKQFARANAHFRDIGALLSEARDNQVLLVTVARLEAEGAEAPLLGLKNIIQAGRPTSLRGTDPGLAAAALARLKEARDYFCALSLEPPRFSVLSDGMERSYRHGRRMLKSAYSKGDDASFHELRKRVQQHWRHMQLLENAWPELIGARIAGARELSQILGDDQDLSVLKAFLKRVPRTQIGPLEARTILGAIAQRQKELRALAAPRARRLFGERPEDIGRHLGVLWSSARKIKPLPRGAGSLQGTQSDGQPVSQPAAQHPSPAPEGAMAKSDEKVVATPRLKASPAEPVAVAVPIR